MKPKLVKTLQTGLKKWRSVLSNFPGAGCWTITAHDTGRWIHQGDTKRKRLNGMQCLTCPIAGPFFGEMIEVIVLNIWEVRTESVGHAWAWPLEQHLFTFFFEQYRGGRSPPTFRIYSLSSLSWATSHLHFAFCLSMQVCNQFHIQNYGICWIYRLTSEELIQSADHGMLHRPESPSVHEWFRFFSRSWFDLTIPMYLRHWR